MVWVRVKSDIISDLDFIEYYSEVVRYGCELSQIYHLTDGFHKL